MKMTDDMTTSAPKMYRNEPIALSASILVLLTMSNDFWSSGNN